MNPEEVITYAAQFSSPTKTDKHIEDADGNMMRLDKVKPYDMAKDRFVRKSAMKATKIARLLIEFRQETADELQAFIEKIASEYEVKLGGKLGGVTVLTYDRRFRMERSIQKREVVNEKFLVIKEIIEECVSRWSKGAKKDLQVLVAKYLKTDSDGNYDARLLRSLKRENIGQDDPQWQKAMAGVDDCIDFVSSAIYYRFAVRDESGIYHAIPLSISDV